MYNWRERERERERERLQIDIYIFTYLYYDIDEKNLTEIKLTWNVTKELMFVLPWRLKHMPGEIPDRITIPQPPPCGIYSISIIFTLFKLVSVSLSMRWDSFEDQEEAVWRRDGALQFYPFFISE